MILVAAALIVFAAVVRGLNPQPLEDLGSGLAITLVYKGAIDNNPTARTAEPANLRNHVLAALEELKAGKPVSQPTSKPYGCGVKY